MLLNRHVGAYADGYEGIRGIFKEEEIIKEGCIVLVYCKAHGLVVAIM